MKPRRHFVTAIAVAAIGLAGCGSPSAGISFNAPPGWAPSASILGLGQIWKSPDKQQFLMLMKIPVQMKPQDTFKTVNMEDARVEKQQHVTICGGQPAIYLKSSGTSTLNGKREPSTMEMIMSSVSGSTYVAMYARPEHAQGDGQAESAIHSLCAKK
jgi:hypothetical protein